MEDSKHLPDRIWLSPPHMGKMELPYIQDAFKKNWITTAGDNIIGFEKDLENYLGNENNVIALNSGTAALHLALKLLGVSTDDEVICQSFTFAGSAFPIVYQNARPVFVDSETSTWNLCPQHLENAIKDRQKKGKNIKAIIAVHLYGMPYNSSEIRTIADKYEIPLVEDAAEALGSRYKNQKCGTFGDIAILSFNGNKIITTSGGGALVSKNKKNIEKAIYYATQAKENTPFYQHNEIGYNYRMSNISAGIGRGQMHVLDTHIEARRKVNQFYKTLFENMESITVHSEPDNNYFSNHWLSCIIVNKNNHFDNKKIRLALEKENIESRYLWKPLHLQPVFKDAPFYGSAVSENLFNQGLCLPSGSNLTSRDLEIIKKVFTDLYA